MRYRPLDSLMLVERADDIVRKTSSAIYVPETGTTLTLSRFKVLAVGSDVKDVEAGNFILAENMFQEIDKTRKNFGMLNRKYVMLIEE
jgi:hypothetical protein